MLGPKVLQINEMIDLLEDFTNEKQCSVLSVGGMAGTFIIKHALDALMTRYEFGQILIIDGCQDYIGMNKERIINNHIYYVDLFSDYYVSEGNNCFLPSIMQNHVSSYIKIDNTSLCNYECLIINNAHLIPVNFVQAILSGAPGRVLIIADPFDINGENFAGVPTICDSLHKLSPILSLARSTYNIETRAIDKTVKGTISEVKKMSIRSIGKIDDKQYVTNDNQLYDHVISRQLQSPFRKNQKLFITDDRINASICNGKRGLSLHRNSMCIIQTSQLQPKMKLRLYSSKLMYMGMVTYSLDPPFGTIRVKPANILMLDESCYHRYNHTVIALNDEPITPRQKYSILKNSNNVTITHI